MTVGTTITCLDSGRSGKFLRTEARGHLVQGLRGGYRFYATRIKQIDLTDWGEPFGGKVNPELAALAAKARRA